MKLNKISFVDNLVINNMEYTYKSDAEKTFFSELKNKINSLILKLFNTHSRFEALSKNIVLLESTKISKSDRQWISKKYHVSLCQPPQDNKQTNKQTCLSKNTFALLRAGFSSDLVNQCLDEKKLQEAYEEFRNQVRADTEIFLEEVVKRERNYVTQNKDENAIYQALKKIRETLPQNKIIKAEVPVAQEKAQSQVEIQPLWTEVHSMNSLTES